MVCWDSRDDSKIGQSVNPEQECFANFNECVGIVLDFLMCRSCKINGNVQY